MAKDLFSSNSNLYAQFRPHYPQGLFQYILSFVTENGTAWDCATGNGQAAAALADYFKTVNATDISEAQLNNAVKKDNIIYSKTSAENTPFRDDSFDLITVATAYHWFHHNAFFNEATRVGKNGCVVAVWTYTTLQTENEKLNALYQHFYNSITAPYWEPERRFVDEEYKTIPFDFKSLPLQPFYTRLQWNREQLSGYLSTWSAVQKYIKINGTSPLKLIEKELAAILPNDEIIKVAFPLSLRLGRIVK